MQQQAESRARDPEYEEKRERVRRSLGFAHADVLSLDRPEPMTIPTDQEWTRMREIATVEVRVPDCSRTVVRKAVGSDSSSFGETVVNTHVSTSRYVERGRIVHEFSESDIQQNPDDLDKDCYGPHHRGALALLNPKCFFHGWDVVEQRRTEIVMLERPADLLQPRRSIPLSNPRILGDVMNPTVFDETEAAEIVVDREHGVILEWRALFEGNVYERHFFSDIAFDVPIDPALLAIPRPSDRTG